MLARVDLSLAVVAVLLALVDLQRECLGHEIERMSEESDEGVDFQRLWSFHLYTLGCWE